MEIKKGIKHRTIKDITSAMYKTPQTDFVKSRCYDTFKNVPNEYKFTISNNDEYFYSSNVHIVAIPKYLFLLYYTTDYMEVERINRGNPMLSDDLLEDIVQNPLMKTIENLESEIDDTIKSFKHHPIKSLPCFVWVFKDNLEELNLVGVYSGIPDWLSKTVMSKNIIYDCSSCDAFMTANIETGMMSAFYYDKDNNYYCVKCKGKHKSKKMALIGEDIR